MWRAMTVFCRSNPTWWLEASYLFKKARRSLPSMNSRATHKSESESQATPIKDTISDLGFGQERVDVLKTGACGRWQHFNCHSSLVEDATVYLSKRSTTEKLLHFDLVSRDSLGSDDLVLPQSSLSTHHHVQ
ncbi:hypothetical protein JG687_00002644 [Phytophthora cactorum]|uniref:Uncharacterized protein n=1 Tax=Phytophthora cactorum TaxID=29920 RepID=A0A8T1UTQ9_9STRA|nr:hypothetical protein JG687_00002644 [Phytophthora cactorum]